MYVRSQSRLGTSVSPAQGHDQYQRNCPSACLRLHERESKWQLCGWVHVGCAHPHPNTPQDKTMSLMIGTRPDRWENATSDDGIVQQEKRGRKMGCGIGGGGGEKAARNATQAQRGLHWPYVHSMCVWKDGSDGSGKNRDSSHAGT